MGTSTSACGQALRRFRQAMSIKQYCPPQSKSPSGARKHKINRMTIKTKVCRFCQKQSSCPCILSMTVSPLRVLDNMCCHQHDLDKVAVITPSYICAQSKIARPSVLQTRIKICCQDADGRLKTSTKSSTSSLITWRVIWLQSPSAGNSIRRHEAPAPHVWSLPPWATGCPLDRYIAHNTDKLYFTVRSSALQS